ncbi:MAG: hypothetical protein ACXU84_06565 [Xanthobacteraceae bacterium]
MQDWPAYLLRECVPWEAPVPTAKANKRVQFGYGLNYMIDTEHAVIVDVEARPARTYDVVVCPV